MKMTGGRGAERDKGGTSQIGNISFQHVLSEHFICEKRHKRGDLGSSKAQTQFSDETTANSSMTEQTATAAEKWERGKTLFLTPATHPIMRQDLRNLEKGLSLYQRHTCSHISLLPLCE